jgi:hypothetical protein
MNSNIQAGKTNEVIKAIESNINKAMIIPQYVWDRLDKSDMTNKSIRDRILCIPNIKGKG